jgi:hypothetical protein
MEMKEIMGRLLTAVDISDSQIDLVGKILSLEEDKDRVFNVKLHHLTIGYNGLLAHVNLLKNFQNVDEFKEYLLNHNLPIERTCKKDDSYFLYSKGVKSEFYVPEFLQ